MSPPGVSAEGRSPSPTERPSSTPLSFDTRDGQYGHRLIDLVNNWREDTRRMLREELTSHSREQTPAPSPVPLDDSTVQTSLQTILTEVRHLQRQSAGYCDHCGALGRVAIAQEELAAIVRGHLALERTGTPENRTSCPTPSTTASETQATLQKLATELTLAFQQMQEALKGSTMLVEETRRSHEHEQREQPFDNAPLRDDLRQVKADLRDLKESLALVQQKSEQDTKRLLQQLEHLGDVVTVSNCKPNEDPPASQKDQQRMLEGLQHVTELIGIDHRKAREDAAVVRQSVCVLEAAVCQFKDSMTTSQQQSAEEMMQRLSVLEDLLATSQTAEPARLPCQPAIPDDVILRRSGPTWVELTWEEPCELLLELRSAGFRRTELAFPPVQLEGLRPNTEYAVAVSTLCEKHQPVPKLSFVTPQEDELSSGATTSLTAVMKDLGSIKQSVDVIHAAAANAELLRHLGALQDRWASLQVSCLTEEMQKLQAGSDQMKEHISMELKPVLSELQGIHQALAS